MQGFKLKNVAPGYKPPATWEEVAAFDRMERLVAARFFLRQAAIRLHEDANLHPDDIKTMFDAVPEWIDHQQHAHKREQAELRKIWVCNKCGHRAQKHEFFKPADQLTLLNELPMARCPECGQCDAEELVEQQMPGVKPAPLGELQKDGLRVAQNIDSKAPGYVGEEPCSCEGQKCPVCQGMQVPADEVPLIKDHHCSRCNTTFCKTCHGVKTAQLSRAYDDVRRCRCGIDG